MKDHFGPRLFDGIEHFLPMATVEMQLCTIKIARHLVARAHKCVHFMPFFHKLADEISADKSGCAGHECPNKNLRFLMLTVSEMNSNAAALLLRPQRSICGFRSLSKKPRQKNS